VRHLLPWLATWVALFWLWLLLAGEWNRQEWIAAASAATVAATVGEIARTRAGVNARVPLRWIGKAWTVPVMVFVDFGILVWALCVSLVRREVVRGTFRSHEFPAGGDDPTSVGVRAWAALAAMYSPNAYVVEIEPERGLALLHDLVPFRKSEEPA
jgi:hypothetical protein